MGARILVPTHGDAELAARLERLERRIGIEGDQPAAPGPIVSEPEPEVVSPPEAAAETEPEAEPEAPPTGSLSVSDVRRLWPGVLDKVKDRSRRTWLLVSHNAQVLSLDADALTLGLINRGARDSFVGSDSVDHLRDALREVLGVAWKVDAIVDPTATPEPAPVESPKKSRGVKAPENLRAAASAGPSVPDDPDAAAHPDDPVVEPDGDPEELLSRELGAEVIEE
jgi:DNA polymerase-3 subunit gamma/tau